MLVRPFVLTGGRTRAEIELALESLVVAAGVAMPVDEMSREHRIIYQLCAETLSIAEIAAHARLPIGVAKVLVADLLTTGSLVLCSAAVIPELPSMNLMTRVLNGLHSM